MTTRGLPLILLSMLSLSSCAVFPDATGTYAKTWTAADNEQLLALVHSRSDIERTIRDIEMLSPDRAHIVTTKGNGSGYFNATEFTIQKKQQSWTVVGAVDHTMILYYSCIP